MTTINQNMIAICHSYPTSVSAANNLPPVVASAVLMPVKRDSAYRAIEADGMDNYWYIPRIAGGTLHSFSINETLTLSESVKRKLTLVCTWIQAGFTYG